MIRKIQRMEVINTIDPSKVEPRVAATAELIYKTPANQVVKEPIIQPVVEETTTKKKRTYKRKSKI